MERPKKPEISRKIGHLRGFKNSIKRHLSAPLRNGGKPLLKGALFVFEKGAAPQLPPATKTEGGATGENPLFTRVFDRWGAFHHPPIHLAGVAPPSANLNAV